jgi:hypothetical protein
MSDDEIKAILQRLTAVETKVSIAGALAALSIPNLLLLVLLVVEHWKP